MFALNPAGYRYRPLREGVRGHDVVALQYALGGLVADGVFGAMTNARVLSFQREHDLTTDGIAGVVTQREAILAHLWPAQREFDTPPGLARGMIEGESGFQVGNHTPLYTISIGGVVRERMDVGVVMFQTDPRDDDAVRRALNVPRTIERLLGDPDRGMRPRHDRYYGQPGAQTDEDAWKIAIASWNAPSWADRWAARGRDALTASQQTWLDRYIATKAIYVKSWRDPRGLA